MKKRLIHAAASIYTVFAILAAYTAVAPLKAIVANSADNQTTVAAPSRPLCDRERLDFTNTTIPVSELRHYSIVAWTSDSCFPCRTWKARELPALLKAGLEVEVKDIDEEERPDDVTSVPTIMLYYKGEFIEAKVNWKAKAILKFIEGRMSLKK